MRRQGLKKNYRQRVHRDPDDTYGVPWMGRHPGDPKYSGYHDDPYHYEWGCDWATVLLVFLIIVVILVFAASWWWAPNFNHTHAPSIAFPEAAGSGSGSGGEMIPGLGLVAASSTGPHGPPGGECPPGSRWGMTMRLCEPILQYPMAVETALIDIQVHMCDSFYRHSCGTWLKWQEDHDIGDRGGYADRSFSYLFHHNRWILDRIVEQEMGGTPLDNFYHACINALVKHKYANNAQAYRDDIMGKTAGILRRMSDLPIVLARLVAAGFVSPITFGIENHPTRPMMVPFWGHDGFPAAHTTRDVVQKLFETANPANIARRKTIDFLSLNRIIEERRPDDQTTMGHTMREYATYLSGADFERDLSTMREMRIMMHDPPGDVAATATATTRVWSVDAFINALQYHKFDQGANTFPSFHPVWVRDKHYYRWFFSAIGPIQAGSGNRDHTNVRRWKAWVEFSVLYGSHDFAPALEHNAYYHGRPLRRHTGGVAIVKGIQAPKRGSPLPSGRTRKSGGRAAPGETPVTKLQCARITQELLAGYVAKRFLQNTYSATQETHDRVLDMVRRIRARFVQLIKDTWWLGERDRKLTIEKLEAIIIRVAQPHHWHEEPFGHDVTLEHYWRNLDMARRYHVQRNWERWDADADRAHRFDRDALQRFGGALSTINAYYSPMTNTITVYAGWFIPHSFREAFANATTGILQHPFYSPRFNNASLYAILGSVVGHEMTHALDPMGRMFDKDGSFHRQGWWHSETHSQYMRHIACVIHEYGSHTAELEAQCPNIEQHIVEEQYGARTITEDLSDIVGTRLAFEAYFLDHPEGKKEPLSTKQHFFYAYAQIWCTKADEQHHCDRIYNDVHPVPEIRVDSSCRHSTYFAEAFGCQPDQAMGVEAHCNVFGKSLDASDQTPPPQEFQGYHGADHGAPNQAQEAAAEAA